MVIILECERYRRFWHLALRGKFKAIKRESDPSVIKKTPPRYPENMPDSGSPAALVIIHLVATLRGACDSEGDGSVKLRVLVSLWKVHVRAQLFLAKVAAGDQPLLLPRSRGRINSRPSIPLQSMSPIHALIAKEAGLFKKYNLDFDLVHIASSPTVTAAMLGGNAEVALTGGEGIIRAYVQGAADFCLYRQRRRIS